ncbi:phosphotransferase family protein [Leifsonia poae]|uniref:phosphotransferase family protein n=1 Tax=Leifsonia poae TaxID=110933 RepID=UPI003D6643E2
MTPATLRRLARWLEQRGLLAAAPVTARLAGDGHSNLTYLVSDGERTVVVRRPPPPPTPPGANDVLREASILRSLAGSGIPVPDVLAQGETDEVFDVPFFVMRYVPGPIVTDRAPDGIERARLGRNLTAALAGLHAVDWVSAGLRGNPDGSNIRHRARLARLIALDGEPPAEFADVDAWLVAHAPTESGAALVHNDFRLGNVILDASNPSRIAAVLDWELAAVADPLVDVGYLVASWAEPGREPATAIERLGAASSRGDFPTRLELVDWYEEASGRTVGDLAWYVVLAEWKLAVLWEYNRRRFDAGVGDAFYADPTHVTEFLDVARRWAERA